MTACLLCPSPAVADGLCVDDGAKKWAADVRLAPVASVSRRYLLLWAGGAALGHDAERERALRELSTPESARAFLGRLDAARKDRESLP